VTGRGSVVRFARRDDERRDQRGWVGRVRAQIKSGQLDDACARFGVRPASVLAILKLLASGRFPSFWRQGVWAKSETLGSDPDVGLSGRQVRRVIDCMVMVGCIERIRRNGTTSLLRPANSATERGHYGRGSADIMAADSTDNITDQQRAEANSQKPAHPAPNPGLDTWLAVRKWLTEEIGNDVFLAWFDDVTLERIEPQEGIAIMRAPTKFMARHIEQNYGDVLLRAWRACEASVKHVRFDNRANRNGAPSGAPSTSQADPMTKLASKVSNHA
jgi:DnaA N-terminal domain